LVEEEEQREEVKEAIRELDKRVRKRELFQIQLEAANQQREVLKRQIAARRRLTKENEQRRIADEDKADEFANTPSGARYGSDKQ